LINKNKERFNFLKKYLNDKLRILELGCAEGSLGKLIKNSFEVKYSGVEPSGDVEIAKMNLDKIYASIKNIPKNVKFNLIIGFHVLEHINYIKQTISKLYRLLEDNGFVVFEVPNYSGNKRLPWDFNKEHIHLFSAASLSCLLEKCGFKIIGLNSGYHESVVYNDSLRVVACKKEDSRRQQYNLSKRFHDYLGKQFVVYGAGGDLNSLVSPYIKSSDVLAIIDSSEDKIGKRLMGKTIQGPGAVKNYSNKKFLLATYRFQNEILKLLVDKGVNKTRIVTLEDIFGSNFNTQ
jgi:SAM-dependent methyltransferase